MDVYQFVTDPSGRWSRGITAVSSGNAWGRSAVIPSPGASEAVSRPGSAVIVEVKAPSGGTARWACSCTLTFGSAVLKCVEAAVHSAPMELCRAN